MSTFLIVPIGMAVFEVGVEASSRIAPKGEGLPQDNVLAYMWANLANAQGFPVTLKPEVAEKMTDFEIAEAQRMSREWSDAHNPP
ncbi:MAG: hypothetical protein ABIT37_23000 [Luteolibacter sp.]